MIKIEIESEKYIMRKIVKFFMLPFLFMPALSHAACLNVTDITYAMNVNQDAFTKSDKEIVFGSRHYLIDEATVLNPGRGCESKNFFQALHCTLSQRPLSENKFTIVNVPFKERCKYQVYVGKPQARRPLFGEFTLREKP